MKTLYFPFTWISEAQLAALERFFARPVMLAPSEEGIAKDTREMAASGRIDLQVPIAAEGDRVAAILREYRNWADLRGGGDLAAARGLEGSIPFFSDSHVAKIRADIRKGIDSPPAVHTAERQVRARLFLQMAQEYDRQRQEIESEMAALQRLEEALYTDLQDGAGDPARRPASADVDPGRFMAIDRIRAWARLFLAAAAAGPLPDLFVTDSRDIFDTVLDDLPRPESVGLSTVAADAAARVPEIAEALVRGRSDFSGGVAQVDATAGGSPFLLMAHIPEIDPVGFFSRFLKSPETEASKGPKPTGTLIAWVRPPFPQPG